MNRILVVDDDADLRENLQEALEVAGFKAKTSSSASEALDAGYIENFDIVLMDLIMPGIKGLDAILEFKKQNPKVKIIVITAFATIDSAIEAIKKGADEFISKPFDVEELLVIIRRVIEEAGFEEHLSNKPDLDNIMGTLSNPLRRKIIKFLGINKKARFSDILKYLDVEDNAKAAFHLKNLKELNIIIQGTDKLYKLTRDGERVLKTLQVSEKLLID
ncbi:response regulator [Candidatus Magnetomonas plexicatena]|uniref:response regulator n=1 Tax=Candidatus Magnetomonas plexicatena TaxID=2552947 RepID=UPI001102CFDE|nr:response regulator [Nitrospirales bacterium LBB_01]